MPLTSYYFYGQDLCFVPRHIRENFEWMADAGNDYVAVGIHEFQLGGRGGSRQLDLMFSEVERLGMRILAIPSRWAGLVAGWPTAAGTFAATHHDAWMLREDGTPLFKGFCGGAVCSVHDPRVLQLYQDLLRKLFGSYPYAGVIWDEIKVFHEVDYSRHAVAALGGPSTGEAQIKATTSFFGAVNAFIRGEWPDARISTFLYADLEARYLEAGADIAGQDYFGIDGNCWPAGQTKGTKVLPGNFERVEGLCRERGLGTFALVETQGLGPEGMNRTLAHLPEFLGQPVDHLAYYYHGGNVDAEEQMEAMKPLLRKWRRGT